MKRKTKKPARDQKAKEPSNTAGLNPLAFNPPAVMRTAAKVAGLQMEVNANHDKVTKADVNLDRVKERAQNMVKAAEEQLVQAKNELSTSMLNHTEAVASMERAGRLTMPVR